MNVTIPDDIASQAGITAHEVMIELACRLFDGERLALWPAARLAGLSRVEFESELRKRGIAVYRPTPEDIEIDAETIRAMDG